jgi:hypothetical protein
VTDDILLMQDGRCVYCGFDGGHTLPACHRHLIAKAAEARAAGVAAGRLAGLEEAAAWLSTRGNFGPQHSASLRGRLAPQHDAGHPHLIGGEFQSDKYPTCPRGKVPLSVKDETAQDLLWQYAQRRRIVDAKFAADLETALIGAGYIPQLPKLAECTCYDCPCRQCKRDNRSCPVHAPPTAK